MQRPTAAKTNTLNVIKTFNEQFRFDPIVKNAGRLKARRRFIVAGMGGSHLAADILKAWKPDLNIMAHSSYGLPAIPPREMREILIIASSYSGDTEETVDAFRCALRRKIPVAAISTGGKLLTLAKRAGAPYVKLPDLHLQPRAALGFSFLALLALAQQGQLLREARSLARSLHPLSFRAAGKALAKSLRGSVPVIIASPENCAVAYNWKIKFNETGKIPAFMNVVPEMNHNEMTGFDVLPSTRSLSKNFRFLLLEDGNDDNRIRRRMKILKRVYAARGLHVVSVPLRGKSRTHRMFSSVMLADWTAYYLARSYGANPALVPMVEEFKHLMLRR